MSANNIKLPHMPKRAKEILASCKNSQEVDRECVLWTLEILNEYKFKPIPMAPQVLQEMEAETEIGFDRAAMDKRLGMAEREDPRIIRYHELKRKIQVENSGNYDWLKHCREVLLKEGQMVDAQRIKVKLDEVKEEQLYILKGGGDGSEDFG